MRAGRVVWSVVTIPLMSIHLRASSVPPSHSTSSAVQACRVARSERAAACWPGASWRTSMWLGKPRQSITEPKVCFAFRDGQLLGYTCSRQPFRG